MNILAGRGSKPSIFGLTAESSESKYVGKFYREARELNQFCRVAMLPYYCAPLVCVPDVMGGLD